MATAMAMVMAMVMAMENGDGDILSIYCMAIGDGGTSDAPSPAFSNNRDVAGPVLKGASSTTSLETHKSHNAAFASFPK